MVVLTSRVTLLAALSSIAAVSVLPSPADAAAVAIREPSEVETSLIARHSRKEGPINALTSTGDGDSTDNENDADTSDAHHSSHGAKTSTRASKSTGTHGAQRDSKPVVPLPAAMDKHGSKKGSGLGKNKVDGAGGSKKHEKEARDTSEGDPQSSMRSLWIGSRGVSVHRVDTLPPRVDKRHHHHHHYDHDDDHNHQKVVLAGDHDSVDMQERSLQPALIFARDSHNRITVDSESGDVQVDNSHARKSGGEPILVNGNNDRVHVSRSPSPHHRHRHHHHADKVVVTGDNDDVHIHRRYPPPNRFHGDDSSGHQEYVPVRRSPMPTPEPHHHHHHDKTVVVEGDHDHVNIHHRRAHRVPPMMISGPSSTYMVEPTRSDYFGHFLDLHVKRDSEQTEVPGSIAIMSHDGTSPEGKKIASLVVAAPNGDASSDKAAPHAFVLNASDAEHSPMYLVKLSTFATNSSTPFNSTTGSSPGTSRNSTTPSYIPVMLRTNVFNMETAQMEKYCATYDPRPSAPSAMTVEGCNSSGDVHKSQVFAYEPGTGVIRPTWFGDEANGTSDDDDTAGDDGDDTGAEDDDTGDNDDASSGNSTTPDDAFPDSSTQTNGGDAGVTDFEQEALNEDFGDATQPPPMRFGVPKTFTSEGVQKAQNVTLLFSPAAPEVGKDVGSSTSTSLVSSIASESSSSSSSTATDSPASLSSVSATSSSTDSFMATTTDSYLATTTDSSVATATNSSTPTVTFSPTSTLTASSAGSSDVNASTVSDSAAVSGSTATSSSTLDSSNSTSATASDTFNGSNIIAAATPTDPPAFEVKVYNPYASDVSTNSSSDAVTSSSDAATSSSDAATFSSTSMDWSFTMTSSSISSASTSVSAAPYDRMFKQRSLSDLD